MTYVEHACLSYKIGLLFAKASFMAFVHAIYPDVFVTSSSESVRIAHEMMKNAGCH